MHAEKSTRIIYNLSNKCVPREIQRTNKHFCARFRTASRTYKLLFKTMYQNTHLTSPMYVTTQMIKSNVQELMLNDDKKGFLNSIYLKH